MKYAFAKRVLDVPTAGIDLMMRYASKYADIVSLGQGTPLFPTPAFIYDYINKRAKTDTGLGMYASARIEKELLDLIVKQMQRIYGFMPVHNELYLTVGGIGSLFSAFMSLLESGDQVIYFDPSYPLHLSQIHLTGAKPVLVSYDEQNGWRLDLAKLRKSITGKTKAIILTNPNNPTGTVLAETEVRALAEIVLEHNLILVLDEAYEFLTYDKPLFSPLRIPELRDHIILCKSFSKEYAMTGWRIGYVYANEKIISKINDVHVYFAISPATVSIAAAIAALSDERGEKAMKEFKLKFTESRTAICGRLDRLAKLFSYHKPLGAYYVFPKILGINTDAKTFAKMLIDDARVITIPGDSMGPAGKNHLRMSFAADSTVINQAFDRIDDFARKHKLL